MNCGSFLTAMPTLHRWLKLAVDGQHVSSNAFRECFVSVAGFGVRADLSSGVPR